MKIIPIPQFYYFLPDSYRFLLKIQMSIMIAYMFLAFSFFDRFFIKIHTLFVSYIMLECSMMIVCCCIPEGSLHFIISFFNSESTWATKKIYYFSIYLSHEKFVFNNQCACHPETSNCCNTQYIFPSEYFECPTANVPITLC